jgi:L-threonylcarbamoyladenylate synthase
MAKSMSAVILDSSPSHIKIAAQAIVNHEVVGMPTETVYGLAANCRSLSALELVFQTKNRPHFDPLIVHIAPQAEAESEKNLLHYLSDLHLINLNQIPPEHRATLTCLMEEFWPGPLTFILPKDASIPDLVTSGLANVGIRMPAHPIAQALIQASGCPLAAPSANRFGRISPTTAQAVFAELGDKLKWILDGGPCTIGVESTVLGLDKNGDLKIFRPGGVSREQMERCLREAGHTTALFERSIQSPMTRSQVSPGTLESHYAPIKPFYLLPSSVENLTESDWAIIKDQAHGSKAIGLITLEADGIKPANLFLEKLSSVKDPFDLKSQIRVLLKCLAKSSDPQDRLTEIAQNLFSEMRFLDASEAQVLFCEPCLSKQDLGAAIADRLARAAAKQPLPSPSKRKSNLI